MEIQKKQVLYFLIAISFLPIFILSIKFIATGFFDFKDIFWIIGSLSGLLAYIFLFWQYFLGIKSLVKIFTTDVVSIINLHKFLGINGILLLLIHPITLFIEYLFNRSEILIKIIPKNMLDLRIMLGEIALVLVLTIWTTSHIARNRFSFRWWKKIHILTYAILPIVYLHADEIGTFFQDGLIKLYIKGLSILFALFVSYRFLKRIGILKFKYVVTEVKALTHDTSEIKFKPINKFIEPQNGQFLEIQIDELGESHPFTIASYDKVTQELSIVVKRSGKFSNEINDVKVGQRVFVDGAYGVFAKETYESNSEDLVLIAGGIGITPFLTFINEFKKQPEKFNNIVLFNCNKSLSDIAFKNDLENLNGYKNFKIVNVLSNENPGLPYENGYLTLDLIKKYLYKNLSFYKFFICGPQGMMDSIKAQLKTADVKRSQIFTEEFGW